MSRAATDLDRLTQAVTEESARHVRLGYALGWLHAQAHREPDMPPDAPAFRVLDSLGITPP